MTPLILRDTETLGCLGLSVVPGLIDVHLHLRDPGFPQKETIASGLRAAATDSINQQEHAP